MEIKDKVELRELCRNQSHWQDLIIYGKCKDCVELHWCRKCGDEIKNEEGLCGNCAN